jgi:DNA polymerase-1
MPIDGALLKEKQKVAEADLERYAAEIARWAGCPINVNSPKQLAQFYYGQGSFEIRKTPKAKKVEFVIHGKGWPILSTTETGQPSTGASAIAELARHLEQRKLLDEVDQKGLRSVTNWARSNKQYNTYLVGLHNSIRHGRVHGRLNQIGTTSGRYSASQPNLQNITTGDKDIYDIRDAFMAEEGFCLVVSDFSQLEYRLLAHFTRDPRLIEMFQNGWDMHSLTTWNIFPAIQSDAKRKFGSLTTEALTWISEHFPDERKKAKTLNFEIIYGVGAAKLGEQLNLSEREAQKMIDGWFSGYSRVRPWMDSILQQASSRGFLRTLSGRVQHADMKKLKSNNRSLRGEHERRLINGVIQGSAADMTSRSSLLIDRDPVIVESKSRLIMQVHDELIQHCPIIHRHAVMARTKAIMERPFARELRVPMPVSIKAGPCWSDAK